MSNFDKNGDTFTKTLEQVVSQMIINGASREKKAKILIVFKYIDESWIGNSEEDSLKLTQWRLTINSEDQGDFLIHDKYEFKEIFKKLLEYDK